jgi:predicted secreted protein
VGSSRVKLASLQRGHVMFTDARSKNIIFVAHCILNQNSISDGTATYPGAINEILQLLNVSDVGIVQMPCPELFCLGLDRGNSDGSSSPILEENTRIRMMMSRRSAKGKIKQLVQQLLFQMSEYRKYDFNIRGIVGVNRSPSCGVETTSKNNHEVDGQGVFIEALHNELNKNNINVRMIGIKAFEPKKARARVCQLMKISLL